MKIVDEVKELHIVMITSHEKWNEEDVDRKFVLYARDEEICGSSTLELLIKGADEALALKNCDED